MTEIQPTTGQGKRRWLLIAFCISLAINLLVLGMVLGARFYGGGHAAAMLGNPAFSVGRAVRQFPEDRRAELWPLAKPHFREMRGELRKLRHAQKRWDRAFQQDPIDFAELDASHLELSAQVAALQTMNFRAIRALAKELSIEERAQLLTALRPTGGAQRHRHHGGRPRQDEPAAAQPHNSGERTP